ncbi:lysophospholipid acyltransferase [Blastomyces parvus]|uniref:Lysophospholipid acyltransferase n=1 Tax=Blastomyces parvus TaxID=2060905 RepID=A0A2B7X4Q2_9EURO|nr:lysophospholipid acyltransferase [Blastomyces parvus]
MLPYINTPFAPVSDATGASIDELKLIASFLLSYPLAGVLKRLPDSKPWRKNVFIVAVSIFYLVGLFDLWDGLRTLLYSAAGAYAIAFYIDGPLMPWIAFVFLMGHMSINHISRQLADSPSTVDITGAQMVLVMKLTAFCWNVHDGRLPQDQLSESQKYAAITKLPSLLDFAGYVFFFPSLFAGPAFDYVEYRKWIETTMFDAPPGVDPAKRPPTRKKRKIPRSGRPALLKAAFGLFWIFGFLQFGRLYNVDFILSDNYLKYAFPRRVWILHMLGFTSRLKYYGVWSLTEGACILSGMGYNGFDPNTGKVSWNRLENVNPKGLETAQSPHAYLSNWNKNTNHWLKNYMYLRVTPKGKKPGFRASLATFVTSAFWHGFLPGYYFTFILGAFIQTTAKKFRRNVRPFFLTPDGSSPTPYKRFYDILSWLTTQLALSFIAAPFVILHFKPSIHVWSSVYYYGIVGIAASQAFFSSPAKGYLVKRLKARGGPVSRPPAGVREPSEQPVLGLPPNPGQDIEDAVNEIKREIELRKRRGSVVTMPSGQELKAAVEEKLGRKL